MTTSSSTLAPAVVTTLVKSLAECMGSAQDAGAALVPFAKACAAAKLPVTPADDVIDTLVNAVSKLKGWTDTPAEKVRKSEARNIVRQHKYLPEMRSALVADRGACGYHDMVKLCRLMGKHGNISAAVAAFVTKSGKGKTDTLKSLERAVQTHYKTVNAEKNGKTKTLRLSALIQVAEAFGFNAVKA